MSRILIILGHPSSNSFCGAICDAYLKAALEAGHDCRLIRLGELEFSPNLANGYQKRTEHEPDLNRAIGEMKQADHLIFVYPTWWSSMPALLKGFIDRTFLPGITFQYREKGILWDKLLKGKTARLITTMDAPVWYYRLVYRSTGQRSLRVGVLNYCGVKPVRETIFSPMKRSTPEMRRKWLAKIEVLGSKGI